MRASLAGKLALHASRGTREPGRLERLAALLRAAFADAQGGGRAVLLHRDFGGRDSPSHAQVVLFFEGNGAESGVTVPGATTFSFIGSNWSGGVVATEGIRSLYASGRFSYEVREGPAQVMFENPVDSASFFYVHGLGFSPGTATAFDDAGSVIASVNSREATFFGDPNNVVVLDPQEPIRRIEFSAGVIDDFRFVPIGAGPPATVTPMDTSIPLASPTPSLLPRLRRCPRKRLRPRTRLHPPRPQRRRRAQRAAPAIATATAKSRWMKSLAG